jgi:hypothetical protein
MLQELGLPCSLCSLLGVCISHCVAMVLISAIITFCKDQGNSSQLHKGKPFSVTEDVKFFTKLDHRINTVRIIRSRYIWETYLIRKFKKKTLAQETAVIPQEMANHFLKDFIKLTIQLVRKTVMVTMTFAVTMAVLVLPLYLSMIDNTI